MIPSLANKDGVILLTLQHLLSKEFLEIVDNRLVLGFIVSILFSEATVLLTPRKVLVVFRFPYRPYIFTPTLMFAKLLKIVFTYKNILGNKGGWGGGVYINRRKVSN